jgi:5-methylcytosine-specific restriction endonuclease McrA
MKRGESRAIARSLKSLTRRTVKRGMAVRMAGLSDNEIAAQIQSADAVLHTAEWKALRKSMLERHGAKCMKCGVTPKNPAHINVDHIKCRKFYPELALDQNNLQLLCGRCNKAKGNKHMTDYRKSPEEATA